MKYDHSSTILLAPSLPRGVPLTNSVGFHRTESARKDNDGHDESSLGDHSTAGSGPFAQGDKKRIFVVDPHPLTRQGIASLIATQPDLVICGETGDANSALRGIMKLQPDVVIAGICMPGHSGLELIKSAKLHSPGTHFIILSSQPESVYAMRVLKAGGQGYVMKSDPPEKLLRGIRCTLQNRVFVSDEIADQMLNHFVGDKPSHVASSIDSLSDRELDVMNLIGQGVSTREIAARLHISAKTVETHRAHLKAKLHIESATRFVQYCARWVDANDAAQPA